MKYYVDARQTPSGDGTRRSPFATLSQAAAVAGPGDEVLVAPGVYREEVSPARGGLDDKRRIVYRSEIPGAAVLSGAEIAENWTDAGEGVWKTTLPNEVFGGDNPFADRVFGDWFYADDERPSHRGDVYLDGHSMYEAFSMDELRSDSPSPYSREGDFSRNRYLAQVENDVTVLYIHLAGGAAPAGHTLEYGVRRHCFYPARTGVNYITLSGFTVCMAVPQWAPPTAYQEGMIGPHWAKGWIIENCRIFESKCVGVSLGKYRQPNNDNKWTTEGWKHGTQTEREAVCQAVNEGWSRETVGSHIVRNCEIHHCGQAGIAGHMGCAFSRIENNHIHHINNKQDLNGAEIGGIKLHAAIDTVISGNHIHHCTRGLWLDWQAQGVRVTGNCFHHNQPEPGCLNRTQLCFGEDLFIEVSHGPTLVDNNLLLSVSAARISAQGVAFAHNLIAGSFTFVGAGTNNAGLNHPESVRFTPYHVPHGTAIAGFMTILHGDAKFYGNVFVQRPVPPEWSAYAAENGKDNVREMNLKTGLGPYAGYPSEARYREIFTRERIAGDRAIYYLPLPVWAEDNVYCNGALPSDVDRDAVRIESPVSLTVEEENGVCVLTTNLYDFLRVPAKRQVTSDVLGRAFESEQRYEQPDGSPIVLNADLLGRPRGEKPLPGPLEYPESGVIRITLSGEGRKENA